MATDGCCVFAGVGMIRGNPRESVVEKMVWRFPVSEHVDITSTGEVIAVWWMVLFLLCSMEELMAVDYSESVF